MDTFAQTPEPPYYAVIFTSIKEANAQDYSETADKMLSLAAKIDGFLGVESLRNENGFGITVSYWRDSTAISNWKNQTDHLIAQDRGKQEWYRKFFLRVAKVERHKEFQKPV